MNRSAACWLACAVLTAAGQPASGRDLHPGIIGEDDRVRVDAPDGAWDAVGQVNVGGYRTARRCTGTLVAPDRVLTAAHCVMNPSTRRPFPLRDIHFLAGVRGPENKGHTTARCLRFPKDLDVIASGRVSPATDVVVIVLNGKLPVEPAPLAVDVIATPGLRLVHAAYSADRRYALSVHFDCRLLESDPRVPLWSTDCDTHPASSGGPLFIRSDGTLKLTAIMLGTSGRIANWALPVSRLPDLLDDAGCP